MVDRFASLLAPPFKTGLREAIWNRYIPFREALPFRTGSFTTKDERFANEDKT
jgi:hypothetical protein